MGNFYFLSSATASRGLAALHFQRRKAASGQFFVDAMGSGTATGAPGVTCPALPIHPAERSTWVCRSRLSRISRPTALGSGPFYAGADGVSMVRMGSSTVASYTIRDTPIVGSGVFLSLAIRARIDLAGAFYPPYLIGIERFFLRAHSRDSRRVATTDRHESEIV